MKHPPQALENTIIVLLLYLCFVLLLNSGLVLRPRHCDDGPDKDTVDHEAKSGKHTYNEAEATIK